MIELFSLERVNRGPASLDVKKLAAFQERAMQALPVADRVERALPYLQRVGLVADPVPDAVRAVVTRIVAEAGPRLAVAGDILNFVDFFVPDERLPYEDRAFDRYVRKMPDLLRKARTVLVDAATFDAATLQQAVEALAVAEGVKHGPVSQTLRVAVTGKDVGFGAYETLAILGRVRCLARIDKALARL